MIPASLVGNRYEKRAAGVVDAVAEPNTIWRRKVGSPIDGTPARSLPRPVPLLVLLLVAPAADSSRSSASVPAA